MPLTVSRPDSSFVGSLARAYRRAARLGLTVVRTDLVLYYVFIHVPAIWRPLPGALDREWRPVRRGFAVAEEAAGAARSRLTPRFDAQAAVAAEGALRLAAYRGADVALRHGWPPRRALPEFSPAVHDAVYEAIHEASRSGAAWAAPAHLLVGLLSTPANAAGRVLAGWSHQVATLREHTRSDPHYRDGGKPDRWVVDWLAAMRLVPGDSPRTLRWFHRVVGRWGHERPYRRYGARYGHVLVVAVESAALDWAVMLGRDHVSSAEVLLALLDFHHQIADAGHRLPAVLCRYYDAGRILHEHGVGVRAPELAIAGTAPDPSDGAAADRAGGRDGPAGVGQRSTSDPADREDDLRGVPTLGWPATRSDRPPVWGRTALLALRSASHMAHEAGHPCAGTTHLLLTALTDDSGPAARMLRMLGVDPQPIRAAAARRLEAPASESTE